MPGMQFFGTAPDRKSKVAQVMEGFTKGTERREKREFGLRSEAREERRIGIQESQFKKQLETIDYEKKRDTANMVISVAKTIRRDKAEEFINKPEVKALFEDLNWPLPTGLHEEVDFKEAAQEAIMKGEPLPNMTMDETRRAAGVFIKPSKITGADVKAFKGAVPWYESLWPGAQTKAGKKYIDIKERQKGQFTGGGAVSGGRRTDPLGARAK